MASPSLQDYYGAFFGQANRLGGAQAQTKRGQYGTPQLPRATNNWEDNPGNGDNPPESPSPNPWNPAPPAPPAQPPGEQPPGEQPPSEQPPPENPFNPSPPAGPVTQPSPGPSGAAPAPQMPSGPITGPDDPRLSNPAYANDPAVLAWLNSIYGPGGSVYHQPPGGTWNPGTQSWNAGGAPGRMDDSYILSQIAQWANRPGANASLKNDPQYWLRRIKETGGLGDDNLAYWQNLGMRPEGAPESWSPQNPNGTGGGMGFNDPAYQQLLRMAQARIAALGQHQSFPGLDEYMAMLKANEGAARQRAQTFADQLTNRVGQLQKPLLTDANVANQRALASNGLLAQRDAMLKNTQEQRYARGFEPTSGLIANDQRSINEAYQNRQAQIDAMLQSQQIGGDEARRNQATQLQGLAQQALQGGDVTALADQARVADMENQMYNLDQQRQREALTTANIPVDLTNMGFSNALNASGMGGNPLASIFALLNGAQNQQGLQQNQTNSNMGALAWLLQSLLR